MNAVEFERVSKSYAIYETPTQRLKELALFNSRSFHREFHAITDLSFTVARGEVFCIVGENGSGKSTTLQLLAGILQPDSGEIRVSGRVAALLELGAGFHPEFTGRENVYLNGTVLGLSKREIDRKYASIEEFAGIGAFIDQPVKTYSSGMAVRLAFAVAIHSEPEVLLVDEALAVGDTQFRHRCMRKIHELRDRAVTIVFVSHSIADVKAIGERVLWLRHGRAAEIGDPDTVIGHYLAHMCGEEEQGREGAAGKLTATKATVRAVHAIPNVDHRRGDGGAEILGIALLNEFGEPLHLMTPETRILVRISFRAHAGTELAVGFLLRNHLGLEFAEVSTLIDAAAGETVTADFEIDIPELYPGSFSFSPWVKRGESVCDWIDNAITIQMARGEGPVYGYVHVPCRPELTFG